jgi:pimeloyl-ACP methyl ester carboxylesterase
MQPTTRDSAAPSRIPYSERSVEANNIRFHLLEAGDSSHPLVLLLHGFPESAFSWRYQIPALAARYHVVAPDLRGYNLSEKPPSGYDIATLADDVRELVGALGHDRAHLAGHDWGGIIAWATAIRHPDVIAKLAIMNAPHPGTFRREALNPAQVWRSSYIAFFQLRGVAEEAISRDDYAMVRRTFRASDRERAWLADDEIQRYVEALAVPGALSAALEYYRQLPRALFELSPLRVISAPTLILWGELDPYLGLDFLRGLDRFVRDLRIQRFPTAGHFLHEQQPTEVNAALAAFLEQ